MAGWQPFETESGHPSFLVSLPTCPTAGIVHVETFAYYSTFPKLETAKFKKLVMWLIVIYRPHTNACNLKAVMKYYLPRKFNICYLVGKETTITTWQIPALTRYSPRGKVSWHQAHWELTITGNLIGRLDEGRQSRLTHHSQGFFQEGAFSPSLLWFARSEELNSTDAGHFAGTYTV